MYSRLRRLGATRWRPIRRSVRSARYPAGRESGVELCDGAATFIVGFLSDVGVDLDDKRVAVLGSTTGFLELSLAHRARPAELVGYNASATRIRDLGRRAAHSGLDSRVPPCLRFESLVTDGRVPAPNAYFDVVVTWSGFSMADRPIAAAREIRRIMANGGVGFMQLLDIHPSGTTLDDLQRALMTADLRVIQFEPITEELVISADHDRYALSDLVLRGVRLGVTPCSSPAA